MTDSAAPTDDVLKQAYKAFKKRYKLTQLDHDSRIGKSPMSGGSRAIAGISPPDQYPRAVWEALVTQGKLVYMGEGTYAMK